MINYFTLFSLEPKYLIDRDKLERAYFRLQMQFHPDRSINQSESQKMLASMNSANVNDGYAVLSHFVERANHLLAISGVTVNAEKNNNFKPSQALLVEQMELREKASDIESGNENKAELLSHIDAEITGTQKEFDGYYTAENFALAAESAMKLKYLDKLRNELTG